VWSRLQAQGGGSWGNQGFPTVLTQGLDEVLVVSPLVGDEELAMWALEALMAIGAAREKLGLEGLLAVRANDLERAFLLNPAAHTARIAL
jgi:hypothetical protein